MLNKMKDIALSKSAKIAINSQIKEFGELLALELNSTTKTIEATLMLEGEKEPLKLKIEKYQFTQEREKHFLQINGIKTSRVWIDKVASTYLEGKRFEMPPKYVEVLSKIV